MSGGQLMRIMEGLPRVDIWEPELLAMLLQQLSGLMARSQCQMAAPQQGQQVGQQQEGQQQQHQQPGQTPCLDPSRGPPAAMTFSDIVLVLTRMAKMRCMPAMLQLHGMVGVMEGVTHTFLTALEQELRAGALTLQDHRACLELLLQLGCPPPPPSLCQLMLQHSQQLMEAAAPLTFSQTSSQGQSCSSSRGGSTGWGSSSRGGSRGGR
ncbi:hypothetical protein V8C86DRAFT_2629300, partial [Haematococcus lacustris]